jgi:hypothetical protein
MHEKQIFICNPCVKYLKSHLYQCWVGDHHLRMKDDWQHYESLSFGEELGEESRQVGEA